jgi:hypothetical protein
LDLQRVALLAGVGLLAFACGEKFTGVDVAAGGSSGSHAGSGGVTTAGSAAGGDGATDGGVDEGGRATTAGSAAGGRGGISSVAGGGGKPSSGGNSGNGGNGGSGGVVVEVPPVPQEGLEAWFSADVGVLELNGVVATWKDRSAHQRDALQTAVNYRPKLGKSALGGKAAIVFDGVDDYLKLPALPGDFSHGVSIFVVAQQDADDGSCSGFFEASNGSEVDDLHLGFWQGALQYEVFENYLHPTDQGLIVGKPELLAVVHQTTETAQLRRNSNAVDEDKLLLPKTIAREDVYIGHSDYTDCKAYPGSIGELLVYSRAVSDAELIEIESYLQAKWGCCAE